MNEHIVVVTGADALDDRVTSLLPADAYVVAADGGLDVALAAGLTPDVLIGDLDSVSDDGLDWADENATIERHPADKDHTDTELALRHAVERRPRRITMVGGGGRLDHTIAALGALGAPHLTSIPELDAWWGGQHVDVVHGPARRRLQLEPGSTLSLIVFGRHCQRVRLDGVRWPLRDAQIATTVGVGVSNEVTAEDGVVSLSLSEGVLTVFDVPRSSAGSGDPHDSAIADTDTDTIADTDTGASS